MELYIVRHGESENNRLWMQTGSSAGRSIDARLTDLGREQARVLAAFLVAGNEHGEGGSGNRFGISHLYTSLLTRAVETAVPVASALALPLVGWIDLHEWWGVYEKDEESLERIGMPGPNRAYFSQTFPELVLPDEVGDDGWWNRPAEKLEDVPQRARRVLETLFERHYARHDHVLLVTHGGFSNSLIAELLNGSRSNEFGNRQFNIWFRLNNASITRIDFLEERIRVDYVNNTDHFPERLWTH